MTSTAYRQSSRRNSAKDSVDPDNQLLGRMSVRRLEAEVIRDSVLAASGKLGVKMFGPPVPVKEDEVGQVIVGIDTTDTAGRPTGKEVSLGADEFRRSVYIQVRRSKPLALLDTFDEPTMEPNCEARNTSTVAPQSLLLMNNEFVVAHSQLMAERVFRRAGADSRQQVQEAWRLAFAREPAEAEINDAVAMLAQQTEHFRASAATAAQQTPTKDAGARPDPQHQALAVLCQAILSTNEFLYVD
jgi:hypothetical protein